MSSLQKSISRRLLFQRLGCGAVGAALAGAMACSRNRGSPPPNILLINADDLGMGDLSSYGGEIPTPNIDSIGEQGMRFTDFYVSSPVCTPSRFSQLTGLVPGRSRHKLMGPLMPTSERDTQRGLEAGETTIAEILKKRGYATALVGKWHLGHGDKRFLPTRHGFDYFYGFTPGCMAYFTHRYRGEACFYRNEELIEEQGYSTDLFTREAVSFIEHNRDNPFYLNLAHNAPHYGKANAPGAAANVLQAPQELIERFHGPDQNRNVYSAMVVSLDNGVGEILKTLERLGLAENTLVIFTSDNGGSLPYGGSNGEFRGQKGTLFEGGIRVPCLIRWPQAIPEAGVLCRQVGSHLDFFPTFAALAGVSIGEFQLDGIDLSETIRNPRTAPTPRTLYWDYGGSQAVRQGNWKYLKDKEGNQYLFDLEDDPYEKTNLIEEKRALAAELAEKLESFFSSI